MTLNACFFHKRTAEHAAGEPLPGKDSRNCLTCLLYTSDAADEL